MRALAAALEDVGAAGEILDSKWRVVFTSTENALALDMDPAAMQYHYGLSIAVRPRHRPDWKTDQEFGARWWEVAGPHMVRDVPPDDPDFDTVFGSLAERARMLEPAPPALGYRVELRFTSLARLNETWHGTANVLHVRLHDAGGNFIGTLLLAIQSIPQTLANRLSRGDVEMYRRMELFLADDAGGHSAAARSAIHAARAIRDGASALRDDIRVKAAVHWGSRLMVGQVSTRGRLEVTALGDEMNQAARIEHAANGGVVLASKAAIEQLDSVDAESLGLDPDALTYRTVAELSSNDKVIRDAGSIPVVAV